jgi:hypothetical protein
VTVGTGHSVSRAEPQPGEPRQPDKKWKLALIGLVAVFVILAGYDLATVSGQYGLNGTAAPGSAAASSAVSPAGSSGALSSSANPGKTGSSVSRSLAAASVAAFGPEGLADGDNPGIVSRVLNVSTGQPWYSQWYATPEFGSLRSGTGILLDMGKTMTVTGVLLVLGSEPGADVQVRVGDSPYLADLPSIASEVDAGGTEQLTALAPAQGRYVLIWFTRLPPGALGHYQVSVYHVRVDGTEPAASGG